jgi:hypothetical protein
MLRVEAHLGRDLIEYLREARYGRHLTSEEIAAELDFPGHQSPKITKGTIQYWYTVLGLRREDLRDEAERSPGGEAA